MRISRLTILSALAGSLFTAAPAVAGTGTNPYVWVRSSAPFVPLTGGTTVFTGSRYDDEAALVPLGFNVVFHNETFTHATVTSNGYMFLSPSCATTTCGSGTSCDSTAQVCTLPFGSSTSPPRFPDTGAPNALIMPFWDDLIGQSGQTPPVSVSYQTLGTAPNRTFVVEWRNIQRYSGTTSRANFQVRFAEGTSSVRIHYGTFLSASDNSNWRGTIGIESADGRDVSFPLPCGSTDSCQATDLIALNNTVLEYALPSGAELIGEATAPTGGDAGSPLAVQVNARNVGVDTTTVAFQGMVFFSTDSTIDRSDTLLGTLNFPALLGGGSNVQTLNTTVPNVAPGYYTIGAMVDTSSVVTETIESNNTFIATTRFLVGADLTVTVAPVGTTGPTEVVNFQTTVQNLGSAQNNVGIGIYLSQDDRLDPTDILVTTSTVNVPALPNNLFTVTGTIPARIVPGDYYVIAKVDNSERIQEADETNNVFAAAATTEIIGPDLYAAAISTPASFIFRGRELRVSATIINEGAASARGFSFGYYLSTNPLISAISDPKIGEFGPITMAPNEQRTFTGTVTVPANIAPGQYYLGVIVNASGAVIEQRTTNNIKRTQMTLEVRDPASDFVFTEMRIPAAGAAGEALLIERTLANQGNAAGMINYTAYLSSDEMIDPATDIVLGQAMAMLNENSEQPSVDAFTIPNTVPPGNYYVALVADPDGLVAELHEDNNTLLSGTQVAIIGGQLTLVTQSLPIGTISVPYNVVLTALGGTGPYMWSSEGMLPAGLTLDPSTGALSGMPTTEGVSDFTIIVTDGSAVARRNFSLLVAEQSAEIEVLTRALTPGYVGRSYTFELSVYGGIPPYKWSLRGALPAGMNLSENGIITGTPMAATMQTLTFEVEDTTGAKADRPMILRVIQPSDSVRLSAAAFPTGRIGDEYTHTISVEMGTGSSPFDYAVVEGNLPKGLKLENDTIFGVPEEVGNFIFSLRVRDDRGDIDVNRYVLEIDERDGVTFVSTSLPSGTQGQEYLDENMAAVAIKAVSREDMDPLKYSLVEGKLPNGVMIAEDGSISGTPTRRGIFVFTILAVDKLGQKALRAFAIEIKDPPPPPPMMPKDTGGCVCVTPDSSAPRGLGMLFMFGLLFVGLRRRRLGTTLALLVGLTGSTAEAGTGSIPYTIDVRSEPYMEMTGGTAISFSSRDDGQGTVNLPFDFNYFGTNYNSLKVSTNGYVVFGADSGTRYQNQAMPTPGAPNNLIALHWDDLESSGEEWFLQGTAPNRIAIIQYKNAHRLSSSNAGSPKIQLWLYEGISGRFEVRYGPVTGATNPTNWTATSGFENADGSVGHYLLPCRNNCNANDFSGGNGQVYRAQMDGGPDIVAATVQAPPLVYPGVPVSVPVSFSSVHANPIGPFSYQVHLVPAGSTRLNTPIFTSTPVTLTAYEVRQATAQVVVPLNTPEGRYRLGLVVDSGNSVVEPSESNNSVISLTELRLAEPKPDFAVTSIGTAAAMAAPGETIMVNSVIGNIGNQDGQADWGIYLSANPVITHTDRLLDMGNQNLVKLSTVAVDRSITIPADLPTGVYYLGMVLDPQNQIREIDELNNQGAAMGSLAISSQNVMVTTTSLPKAYVGQDYSFYLRAAGGDGSFSWKVTSGALPTGLVLVESTGEIRGKAQAAEMVTVGFEVTSGGQTGTANLTIEAAELSGDLTIITRRLLPGLMGDAYPPAPAGTPSSELQRITAVGGTGTVSFSLMNAAPRGLTLAADGLLSGVAQETGTFTLQVEATDGAGGKTMRDVSLTIGRTGRLTLVAEDLPEAVLGQEYGYQLRAIDGTSTSTRPKTYNTMGTPPPGIIVASTGLVAGIPRKVGTWSFPVTVTDGTGPNASTDSAVFQIKVVQEQGALAVMGTLPTSTVGETFSGTLTAQGGAAPYDWRIDTFGLPMGLTTEVVGPEAESFRFTGVPSETGIFSVLVILEDNDGRRVEHPVAIEIIEKPVIVEPPKESSGCTCAAPQQQNQPWFAFMALLIGGGFIWRRRR